MKYLESINLVQFFLYEREHVRISEITGLAPVHCEIPGLFRQMGIASLPPIDKSEE